MNLKFWKRGQTGGTDKTAKLPRPKELSDRVGIYLVTKLKEDPDWVWKLKAVSRPRDEDRRIHAIRIYDPKEAQAKQITVENFASLDKHPELILYSGTINKDSDTVAIEKPTRAAA